LDKKILILLPIWKREKITNLCLKNLSELQKDINIDVLCIVSESWAKISAKKYGFKYVNAPNECLGTKMNIGVRFAMGLNFDYLMNLGSDDIITKELFEMYKPYFKDDTKIFGCTRLTFIDSKSKEAKTFDYKVLIGAGRCIKKTILKEVLKSGELYGKVQLGLDKSSINNLLRYSHTEIENPFNTIYDIKGDVNIWNYEELPGDYISFDSAVKGLDTKIIDNILDL